MDDKNEIEIWLPVVGVNGYDVSSHGRIKSWWSSNRIKNRFFEQPKLRKLIPNIKSGYLELMFIINKKRVMKTVHSLVIAAFKGPRPNGYEVRHLDGNKLNNHESNLEYGTHYENFQDQVRHGTDTRSERNACAKLTNKQAEEIRQRIEAGEEARSLIKIFNVSEATISRIKHGIRYKNS